MSADVDPSIDLEADPEADPEVADVADEPESAATVAPAGRRGRRRRATGSRRRTRQALVVVGIAIASAAGGVLVGRQLKSPADAASERRAPAASMITVPVERRQLTSTLVLSGETRYVEPTPVRLAGNVGASGGERQVITRVPELNQEIQEGAVFMEVSGRPVLAMRGELPMYRQLAPGSTGPDVLQLETSLQTLGFSPGTVDEIYDAGTEAALDAFYLSQGYASEGASETERKTITDARKAVTAAEDEVRKARQELSTGTSTVTNAERLRAQQALESAQAAVPAAETKAQRANDEAARAATTAASLRDNARAARDSAQAVYNAAAAPGAINPETGEPYSPSELALLQQQVTEANTALITAEQEAANRVVEQQTVEETGNAEIEAARDALALAQAERAELDKPKDTTALQEAVTAAEQRVVEATEELAKLEAEIGTIVPSGEVVFLPSLPTTITSLNAQLGAQPPTDQIAQVSSTSTEVIGRVSKVDAELVVAGAPVTIELRDFGIEATGTVADVRKPTAAPQDPNNPNQFPQSSGSDDSRLEVVVTPDAGAPPLEIGYSVRITVNVSSTDAEVLAVPVAAITVGPDGTSRVEVEIERARGTRPGRTELIDVTVGLAAQGFAEVTPLGGATLDEGDRVVVGTETGERRSRRDRDREQSEDEATAAGGPGSPLIPT